MQETLAPTQTASYYRHLGDNRYESTGHSQGAWNPHEQHMAPVAGLMVGALEQCSPRPDMLLTRINFDILGLIPAGEFTLETSVLRPGRTIELLQSELIAEGRVAVRATAWRLQARDTAAVEGCEDTPMPPPEEGKPWDGMANWPGGFIKSLESRALPGHRPGNGRVWLHVPYGMVEGETTSPLVKLAGLADCANGVAARVSPTPGNYMFPNVDLSLHLYRQPVGEWLGVDVQVTFANNGIGLTSAVLHDSQGPFGRSEQTLTVRPLPLQR